MWTEYSNKQAGQRNVLYVYGFAAWEKRVLLTGIPAAIHKLEKQILRIRNHPKNEGQVTYDEMEREVQLQIDSLKEIQRNFLDDIEVYNRNRRKTEQV
jgi:hypothetical protein